FGSGGKVTTDIGGYDEANALVAQADGKLVAAGYSWDYGSRVLVALVRYNSDGSLDTSFGSGGKVTTAIGSSYDYSYALVAQADGKLVAAGYSSNGSNSDF